MADPDTSPDIPPFELPEWGTEGAPPQPVMDDDGVDTALAGEAREITVEVETDVVLSTTSLPAGWSVVDILGLVTGEASVEKDEPEKAAAKARARAVAVLTESAHALGANAVTGLRLAMSGRKGSVTVVAYGTAVRFTRR